MANLKEKYTQELRPALQEELGINNVMAVPKLTKIVINMGVGEAANDKKHLESALDNLTVIAGQKPIVTTVSYTHLTLPTTLWVYVWGGGGGW